MRPMYYALKAACQKAIAAGALGEGQARLFFERNFRPLRITKLGDSAGFLTGYYEPIVDGSRVPTGIFKVPIYRRPPDLVPSSKKVGSGFPNKGLSLRQLSDGKLVPYYDRGQILDGALDDHHLEICWIKDELDAMLIQIEGSARVRLEDGTTLHINYDGHNGYSFVPIGRILIEHHVIPREHSSLDRIRDWIRTNPQEFQELLRQDRSFVFFRITGLSDKEDTIDHQAVGAEGVPLTPERSIAVDSSVHVYGTPFFIEAALTAPKRTMNFDRLMIAQDTGSAIVGPARADIYWGAGLRAGQLTGKVRDPGRFAMLVPRDLDPVAAAAYMPLPPKKPPPPAVANATTQRSSPLATRVRQGRLQRSARN